MPDSTKPLPSGRGRRLVAGALAAAFSATPVAAQEEPSFDCSRAQGSVEELVCSHPDLAQLDQLVAARYAAALAAARGLDVGAAQAEQELRAIQRGWIAGRNECWKAADMRDCVEAAYLRREGDLVARYLLEEPETVATWVCGGNPANEVVTYFFDTTLPSVRIEHGDTVDTGALVRTASGSRYEASFGRAIWIKGDEATYRTADPDGATASCTRVD